MNAKIITVWGANGSGKTTVAANLAAALADRDLMVGIISSKLTYGELQSIFGKRIEPEKGIYKAISNGCNTKNMFEATDNPNLFILSPPNVFDGMLLTAISADTVKELIEDSRIRFDYIIIDGKFLFSDNLLAIATGFAVLPIPYIVFKVRARWYIRNRDEQLESSMNLITNSYLGCNDIIKAVNENLDKLDSPKPFAEFVTDVTLIDSNIKRALMKLEVKINNKYFSEWIDILVLAQEKSGDYRFILPAVVQSMNDAKRLQIEADTVMMAVWRDYFTSVILSFSIIPLLKWSNATWFDILVGSAVGKILIILMLIMTVISAFITLKVNKPL